MSKIAIIGVGDVGATLAYTLQISGLVTEIVLIDIDKERANGHALDMNHGLFFTPSVDIYAGDLSDCRNSDIIIIAAGARQKSGESRLELVQRNAAICRNIVEQIVLIINSNTILLVTTNPVDVMTYLTLKTAGLSPEYVIGSGTLLDSSRFRFALSKHCHVDPKNVHAYVIGEHGDSEVLLWSLVNISGIKLEEFCKSCKTKCQGPPIKEIEDEVRTSAYHIIAAKGFTNYGVSLAMLRILSAIIRSENSVLTVSIYLDGEYGLHDVCLSIPCILNKNGVAGKVEAPISETEKIQLVKSAEVIKSVIKKIK